VERLSLSVHGHDSEIIDIAFVISVEAAKRVEEAAAKGGLSI